MKFIKTKLNGAFIIELEKKEDDRGFFARAFCQNEFRNQGLETEYVQANMSFNDKKGTLRGMHFQIKPFEEVKLVRCTRGSIFDVIIDLRSDSKTFKKWLGVELSADNRKSLYIPKGFAHGYITLKNNSEVFYMVSEFYQPTADCGVRFNDNSFNIKWPAKITNISDKDKSQPDFKESK